MWLPKLVYESIPFYYLAFGAVALGVAFYLEAWYWPEISAGFGLAGLVTGVVLLLRRKGYRASRSRLDFDGRG
jgi:hypothetical protein